MTLTLPRIPPLPRDQWTDAARDLFAIMEGPEAREHGSKFNVVLTLAHHPQLASAFMGYYKTLLEQSTVPLRLRELVTLRVALLQKSEYEWTQHVVISKQVGFGDEHIEAIRQGPTASLWSDLESAALQAVDQLATSANIDDATWSALGRHLNAKEQIELLFVIGTYTLLCWAFNAMGVPLETVTHARA
ncbi:MAG TPA: carboxymuconolactone decarboxylase family protein [Steroidobacter sp.]